MNPYTESVFPYDAVFARAEQPGYVHGEASITSDTRDSRSRPASGGVYRAGWTAYADRDGGAFSFRRYEAEAAQFIPLAARRVVLALHGWIVGSETRADTQIPFYLMPSLGGGNTLRAYSDYRFHDRNLLLVTAESRVALLIWRRSSMPATSRRACPVWISTRSRTASVSGCTPTARPSHGST